MFVGDTPCLIGEIGIPYDMDNKKSYKKDGGYSEQLVAMDANMTALDRNLLNFTIWNYCPDNCHQWGDQWNGEDLSLWSKDTQSPDAAKRIAAFNKMPPAVASASLRDDPTGNNARHQRAHQHTVATSVQSIGADSALGPSIHSKQSTVDSLAENGVVGGGKGHVRARTSPEAQMFSTRKPMLPTEDLNEGARALAAFLRPYPMRTSGIPLSLSFEYNTKQKQFRYLFHNDREVPQANAGSGTEIFLPRMHYGSHVDQWVARSLALDKPWKQQKERSQGTAISDYCFDVKVSDGTWSYDAENQTLHYFHGDLTGLGDRRVQGVAGVTTGKGVHEIVITLVSKREVRRRVATAQSVMGAMEAPLKSQKVKDHHSGKMCAIL